MKLPFTMKQFFEIFRDYNQYFFPLQLLFYLLALITIFFLFKRTPWGYKLINSILALFWLWMGIVYHILFFAEINKAAYVFGTLFIVQGIIFLYFGTIKDKFTYEIHLNERGWAAVVLWTFSLIVYPLLGYAFGHVYPSSPTFGLPCPTTIFTFGVLLCSKSRYIKLAAIIPFLWSLLGFSAALTLGVYEDFGLIVSGIVATGILLLQKKRIVAIT